MKFRLSFALAVAILFALSASAAKPKTGPSLVWGSTDIRYSKTEVPVALKAPALRAWRGERVFAQAVFHADKDCTVSYSVSDFKSGRNVIPSRYVTKAFVGYVLTDNYNDTDRAAQLVADRLDNVQYTEVKAGENQPLWLDIKVPDNAEPGRYSARLTLDCGSAKLTLPISLTVVDRFLPEPENWAFHLDLWQNPYAVARYFKVPLWSKEHFDAMRPVMERYAKAGGKVITASIMQHPWNSQTFDPFESMIAKFKNIDGSWSYDYKVFDKWVEFMMSCGVTEQIDCYTIVPWGYTFEYYDMATASMKTISCQPQDKEYEEYMLPLLTDFARHLRAKRWFYKTCIAMDERPMDQLRTARAILHRADPEYRIQGATDYSPEVVDIMHDISVAYQYVNLPDAVVEQRRRDGMVTTFYTCCGPERPNTFTFSPAAESTFIPLHAAALGLGGYLRWAYNSWTESPCTDSRHRSRDWHGGDCYLVYPEGSSIRFDRLVQGIQDYEKIRILREECASDDVMMSQIETMLAPFKPSHFDALDAASLVQGLEAQLSTIDK